MNFQAFTTAILLTILINIAMPVKSKTGAELIKLDGNLPTVNMPKHFYGQIF